MTTRAEEREWWEKIGMKPYHYYHDDAGKQWLVVDAEDSVVCLVPDNILRLLGEPTQAEEMAKTIAESLTEKFFAAFQE